MNIELIESQLSQHSCSDNTEQEPSFEELNDEEKKARCYTKLEIAKLQRQIELLNFVEEMALSDEFAEYLRKSDCKVDNEVQCDGVSIEEPVEEPRDIENIRVGKKDRNLKNVIRKKQDETIKKIRDMIYEQKIKYDCYIQHKEEQRISERKSIFRTLKTEYGINLRFGDYKSKIVDKVISLRRKSLLNKRAQEQRKFDIIKKILNDYKRDFQIQQKLNKSYDYPVRRKPFEMVISEEVVNPSLHPLEDLDEKHEKTSSVNILAMDKLEEKSQEIVKTEVKANSKEKAKKRKATREKKSKKSAKISVKTKSKAKKKAKKSKSKKLLDKEILPLILPSIPRVNLRKKVFPDTVACDKIIAGINYLKSLDKIIKEFEMEKEKPEDVLFDEDTNFTCTPKGIILRKFENGRRYLKHLELTNTSNKMKKCRFVQIYYITEEDDVDIVQVNCPGILLLAPGISATVPVIFRPLILKETLQGKLLFITYQPQANNFAQLTVNFTFCVQETNIQFTPSTVKFESVPIWHVKQQNIYETVKFINTGKDLGRVCLRRVANDINNEDVLSLTSIPNPDIIRDYPESCLDNVFSNFALQSYSFDITPGHEIKFKIQFRAAEHVGFYVETFQVFIYKRTANDDLVLTSIQEMFVTASTTGYSINIEQKNVDFEICAYNSIYQQIFILENTTRNTLRAVLIFPNCLKDYFIYQKSEILVQGFEKQTVSLKFLPREDLSEDLCEFFDKESGVLEFPLKIATVVYDTIKQPPLKLMIYAILVQPLGVFLRPKDNFVLETNYSPKVNKDLGRCVLTLGNCSTKEFISTQIEIVNNSNCLQHFGFLHLPNYFILSPNYGFGVLEPFQSKMLTMFFVPERREIFDIADKLVVNTIKNLGKIKKVIKRIDNLFSSCTILFNHDQKKLDKSNSWQTVLVSKEFLSAQILKKSLIFFQTVNCTKIAKRLKQLERCLQPPNNEKLMMLMILQCVEMINDTPGYLTIETFNHTGPSSRTVIDKKVDDIEVLTGIIDYSMLEDEGAYDVGKESILECIKNLVEDDKLMVVGNIRDILLDFSAQYVRFKDTPCGTISVATLYLHAHPSYIDLNRCIQRKSSIYDYSACFEITGDNPEICIEPTCGILKAGEKAKIYLVARPELKDDDVVTEARSIKMQELIKLKRAEIKLLMEKERLAKLAKEAKKKMQKSNKVKKDKKTKNKKGKKSRRSGKSIEKIPAEKEHSVEEIKEEDIVVDIKDEDISLTYFDYYPAEMYLWRSMKPYVIEVNFICTVNYLDNTELQGKEDVLQLKAVCKVVRPEIKHNLTMQYFDYGAVVVGTKVSKVLEIQNITCDKVLLNFSRTNPLGPYRLPDFTNLIIPAEYIAKFHVTFNPVFEEEFLEYMEITTENTNIPIILKGNGILPDITFLPLFTVIRLDCPNNGLAESPMQISNNTETEVYLRFEKVCELVGYIRPENKNEVINASQPQVKKVQKKRRNGNKSSKSSSKSKKSKGKKQKAAKLSKYSDFLTDFEEYSLENNFVKLLLSKFFNIKTDSTNLPNAIVIPAKAKVIVKIQFGTIHEEKSKDALRNAKKIKKGKGKEKGSKSSKSFKRSKKDKSSRKSGVSEKMLKNEMAKSCIPPDPNNLCYICKYNVLLGDTTFFKDIIIIGYFKQY